MRTATTLLILCAGALTTLGMVVLYSASMVQHGARYVLMQLVWGSLGAVVCVVAASVDYRQLRRLAWFLYGAAVLLLVLVLIPDVGMAKKGARRWFDLGFASFQPSELAKLALIVVLAAYGESQRRRMDTFSRGVLLPGLIILPVVMLIFREPDFGTAMMLGAVSGIVLLVAGARLHYFLPPLIACVAAIAFAILRDPLRMGRVLAYLNPEASRQGVGYQGYQSLVALGNGGWFGVGLGNGRQKFGFVPEHHTDFIFSMVGEELGFVATIGVVLAFVVLVICGVVIAWNARDQVGMLLGSGLTFLIGLQAFINIGVVTGVLPNKGMPLPFLSYGGSNLLFALGCVGLLVSIARHSVAQPVLAPEGADSGEALAEP